MKRIEAFGLLTILIFTLNACANKDTTPLFQENGDSWSILGDATWTFESNELIGTIESGAGFVITKDIYTDFELQLEFNPDSTINSGVFVRCLAAEISNTDCYEFNIWDQHPNQDSRTGAIVSRTTPLAHVETIGQWNTYTIKNQGNKIQAWVNGTLVADIENNERPKGYIGLQAAGKGQIKFRNVRIKKIQNEVH